MIELMVAWLSKVWGIHVTMAFWLLLGFFFSVLLGILIPASFVNRHLSGKGFGPVWKASLLGVPLPLCSCSVIPTGLGLLKRGASKAATMSFLTSTPQTGIESFVLAGGALGWPFACLKAMFAFIFGILVGSLSTREPQVESSIESDNTKDKSWKDLCAFGFIELPRTLLKPYLMGVVISAVLMQWMQPGTLSGLIGHGWFESVIVILFSIPLYICATASIPLGLALLHQGLSLGGVAIFLISGPATNIISLVMIYKTLGKRSVIVYLTVIILGSVVLSALINSILEMPEIIGDHYHIHEEFTWFNQFCAVALMVLFVWSLFPKQRKLSLTTSAQIKKIGLSGLSCSGCVSKLTRALEEKSIHVVNITTQELQVDQTQLQQAKAVITLCGFKALDLEVESCCQ